MITTDMNLDAACEEFLRGAGWRDASKETLAGDASIRKYLRLYRGDARAVLMIAPPDAETASCPPQASEKERSALGYNAAARLAGPNLNAFTSIATMLRGAGLSAPEIFAADPAAGFALIEDLGDDLYARIVGDLDETMLYAAAIDVLVSLRNVNVGQSGGDDFQVMTYDRLALAAEADLFCEWYWPYKKQSPMPEDLQIEFCEILNGLFETVSSPHVLVLRDFHAENLLWLPQRQGLARVGLIDFQDGLFGHAAYDIVSLLEDARRDVAPDLADAMRSRYVEQVKANDAFLPDTFAADYAILAAQRNAKILGIFARLAKRDNKPRYLDLMPRVEAHFKNDLSRPQVAPLQRFISIHFPDLAS